MLNNYNCITFHFNRPSNLIRLFDKQKPSRLTKCFTKALSGESILTWLSWMSVKISFFFHRNHCMQAVLLHNTYQKKKEAKQADNYRIESRHFVVELRSDEELCPKNCLVCCSRLAAKLTGTQLLIITIISPSVRCGVTCLAHIAF